jgi:hypothetical protein
MLPITTPILGYLIIRGYQETKKWYEEKYRKSNKQ